MPVEAVIGLISDTHGLLRPQALALLAGSHHIVHAGDICDPAILDALRAIAPVVAVRGNNDHGPWAERLPERASLEVAGVRLLVIHDVAELAPGAATGFDVVIHGHSHKPQQRERDGVLYVNPGSAGPRRFTLPISVGRLRVADGKVTVELNEIVP